MPARWTIALGALLFCAALSATDWMVWRSQCADGADYLARRSGGDPQAFVAQYRATHQGDFLRLIVGLPLLLTGTALVYYAPSLIAVDRRHPRGETVFLVNTFCGLTVIGWIWALRTALQQPRAEGLGGLGPPMKNVEVREKPAP
jgi:hypothetical protein